MEFTHEAQLNETVTINGTDLDIDFNLSMDLSFYKGCSATLESPEEYPEIDVVNFEATSISIGNADDIVEMTVISHTSDEMLNMLTFLGVDYENIINDYVDTEMNSIMKKS